MAHLNIFSETVLFYLPDVFMFLLNWASCERVQQVVRKYGQAEDQYCLQKADFVIWSYMD